MNPIKIAQEIRSDLENCMSDLAGGDEVLADDYWNNPNSLQDLLGIKIFDSCNCLRTDDDKILAWDVTDHLLKISHSALRTSVLRFKERHGLI